MPKRNQIREYAHAAYAEALQEGGGRTDTEIVVQKVLAKMVAVDIAEIKEHAARRAVEQEDHERTQQPPGGQLRFSGSIWPDNDDDLWATGDRKRVIAIEATAEDDVNHHGIIEKNAQSVEDHRRRKIAGLQRRMTYYIKGARTYREAKAAYEHDHPEEVAEAN